MNEQDTINYADLIISMSMDFKMGYIDKALYVSNLKLMIGSMAKQYVLQ